MTPFDIVLLAGLFTLLALQVLILVRASRQGRDERIDQLLQAQERGEREMRSQLQVSSQGTRQEIGSTLAQFQQTLAAQITSVATVQNNQIDSFSQQLAKLNESNTQHMEALRLSLTQQAQQARDEQGQTLQRFGDTLQQTLTQLSESVSQQMEALRLALTTQAQQGRDEQGQALQRFGDTLQQTLAQLSESNARRMAEMRATLEEKMRELQTDNGKRLEEMRQTVDEKLHATLEHRLGESFKLVSDRLDKVHQGLGEMQQLAIGVGDLKRVLTNVKTRGTWGEVQLAMLLEQMLTPDQYAANVETVPGSNARVEFALRLPGHEEEGGRPVWMPIDAKFPKEQYERLVEAAERADSEGVAVFGRELERAVRTEARTIADKYLAPPLTTDFAILFLPTEGLYAEVMRRPGLTDELQRTCRVVVAGPSTLSALLNSLQMGFRTLALEKRSSEVWQVLGAVKTEFSKFGDVLATTKATLERAARNIEQAETRSRQMARKLKTVEALPVDAAQRLLGTPDALDAFEALDERDGTNAA